LHTGYRNYHCFVNQSQDTALMTSYERDQWNKEACLWLKKKKSKHFLRSFVFWSCEYDKYVPYLCICHV